ncbi:hypothetical protein ASG88_20755 [Nocardioides sp. Soil777]|uniref:helix-turn-helix transcriptional regulator n=1 Tax=Nocardioides sp. Soil777 TaxID=1736409 RepID=UPI0007036DFB|nr:LuxR C-terminal-related transcriptional regulator [Nocardioides sp. Soil777]KRF05922.1 hypothetical protein ASG88_20755 [Nocardioides sp. Soil777]
MPTLTLTEVQQAALRSLMTIDAVREPMLPPPETLRLIGALVPCDAMGIAVVADDGTCAEEVVLPPSWTAMLLDDEVSGAVPLGVVHRGRHRDEADACGALEGVADGLAVGFPLGVDAVGQLWFDRTHQEFTDDDVARLELITPLLQRLMGARATPLLPGTLTVQEQRVLLLVADGMSNAEIAARLFVSVCTVRKHLENAYRKLGVHNRMAAVVALEGGPSGRHEPDPRIPKFA